ncbi:restriction endonuclease subunit S [Clostridium botulinum]|nr:restriction endonuclease subunit S [Clostridium botulinum]
MVESELGIIPKGWEVVELGSLVDIIDNRGKTPPQENAKTEYPIIDVKALSGERRIIEYNNCMKFVSKETYENWFRSGHPKEGDILLSTVGSLAEMKIFYGSVGCIAQNVVALRNKDISNLYLYQQMKYIKNELISYNIGSVQPSIKITHIIKHKIIKPSFEMVQKYHNIVNILTEKIYTNFVEIQNIEDIRDTLLPKLMSGEIRVPFK